MMILNKLKMNTRVKIADRKSKSWWGAKGLSLLGFSAFAPVC